MAIKFFIQTIEPVVTYNDSGTETKASGISAVDSFAANATDQGFDYVKLGETGFIPREQVLFITPYDDSI